MHDKVTHVISTILLFALVGCGGPQRLVESGSKLVVQNECQDAIPKLRKAIRKSDGDRSVVATARLGLGVCAQRDEKHESAIRHFTAGLRVASGTTYGNLRSKRAKSHFLIGFSHERAGRLEQAERRYTMALRDAPGNDGVTLHRGQVYRKLGDQAARDGRFELAMSHFRKSLGDIPGDAKTESRLRDTSIQHAEQHTRRGNHEDAIKVYTMLLDADPRDTGVRRLRAQSHLRLGATLQREARWKDAFSSMQRALEDAGGTPSVKKKAARFFFTYHKHLLEQERVEKAYQTLLLAIKNDPREKEYRRHRLYTTFILAKTRFEGSDFDGALSAISEAQRYARTSTNRRIVRGLHARILFESAHPRRLQRASDRDVFIDRLERAARYQPSFKNPVLLRISEIYSRTADFEQAIEYARRAASNPNFAYAARLAVARYHALSGKRADAMRELQAFYDAPVDTFAVYRQRVLNNAELRGDFYAVRALGSFQRWVQGHRRIRFTVRGLRDLPSCTGVLDDACDPYVVIRHRAAGSFQTTTVDDATFADYDEAFVFDYHVGTEISVAVYDSDTGQDDVIGTIVFGTGKHVRDGSYRAYLVAGERRLNAKVYFAVSSTSEPVSNARRDDGMYRLIALAPSSTVLMARLGVCTVGLGIDLGVKKNLLYALALTLKDVGASMLGDSFSIQELGANITLKQLARIVDTTIKRHVAGPVVSVATFTGCIHDTLNSE